MTHRMLKYTALILQKVSFDRRLFEKEFHKALESLDPTERKVLIRWAWLKFTTYRPQVAFCAMMLLSALPQGAVMVPSEVVEAA